MLPPGHAQCDQHRAERDPPHHRPEREGYRDEYNRSGNDRYLVDARRHARRDLAHHSSCSRSSAAKHSSQINLRLWSSHTYHVRCVTSLAHSPQPPRRVDSARFLGIYDPLARRSSGLRIQHGMTAEEHRRQRRGLHGLFTLVQQISAAYQTDRKVVVPPLGALLSI